MKCVLEILTIRAEAEKAYQEEQKRLDEEAKVKHKLRIEETISLCENDINDVLVEQAMQRKEDIYYALECVITVDRIGNKIIIPLVYDNQRYADGSLSYKPSDTLSYDYDTFIKYLTQFCYTIKEEELYYRRYNWGTQKGTIFTVSLI